MAAVEYDPQEVYSPKFVEAMVRGSSMLLLEADNMPRLYFFQLELEKGVLLQFQRLSARHGDKRPAPVHELSLHEILDIVPGEKAEARMAGARIRRSELYFNLRVCTERGDLVLIVPTWREFKAWFFGLRYLLESFYAQLDEHFKTLTDSEVSAATASEEESAEETENELEEDDEEAMLYGAMRRSADYTTESGTYEGEAEADEQLRVSSLLHMLQESERESGDLRYEAAALARKVEVLSEQRDHMYSLLKVKDRLIKELTVVIDHIAGPEDLPDAQVEARPRTAAPGPVKRAKAAEKASKSSPLREMPVPRDPEPAMKSKDE